MVGWSVGNLYTKLGFTKVSETAINYWYMYRYLKRFHRYNFTKQTIINKYNGDANLTECENMQNLGYDRIWDCGNIKFELVF